MTTNPLGPLSYTNKDFQTIYVELLDLVKKLTNKWDPSISNESDPGVILLKLNAIIGDKNNYNIDKNILEAFPNTVTQDVNARNMYKQLGYKMGWYKSATTDVVLHWVGEDIQKNDIITIPQFTMVTDETGSVVYTLLEDVEFTIQTRIVSVPAIEGMITEYKNNGSTKITLNNIDVDNRLYLDDYTVAQNGIFIRPHDQQKGKLWSEVDNLSVESLGNTYYEFGIDSRAEACYLEFPQDFSQVSGDGLSLKYIVSSGEKGAVAAKKLDRFYDDVTIKVAGKDTLLTTDLVQLYNTSLSTQGSNPETVSDAWRGYKKTVGTFNTLVTLRDYMNALYNSGYFSNALVCDRNNDVQSSYSVVTDSLASPVESYVSKTQSNGVTILYEKATQADSESEDTFYTFSEGAMVRQPEYDSDLECYKQVTADYEEEMHAFDLKMYLLKNSSQVTSSAEEYDKTFELISPDDEINKTAQNYLEEQKSILHDFQPILPDVPCMFKVVYPLDIRIVPQYKLEASAMEDVQKNILKSLRAALNSRAIEWGKEPDFTTIYDIIATADERIKLCVMDDFSYVTYAVYWDSEKKQFKEIPISLYQSSDDPERKFSAIFLDDYLTIQAYVEKYKKRNRQKLLTKLFFITDREFDPQGLELDTNRDNNEDIADTAVEAIPERNSKTYIIYKWDSHTDSCYMYSDKLSNIRLDIIVKSILAGKTPLFLQDTDFEYGIHQQYVSTESVDRLSTYLTVAPFRGEGITQLDYPIGETAGVAVPLSNETSSTAEYTLSDNESIRFLGPSFDTSMSYSNYVKFEAVLKSSGDVLKSVSNATLTDALGTSYIKADAFEDMVLSDWRDLLYANLDYDKDADGNLNGPRSLKLYTNAVEEVDYAKPSAEVAVPNTGGSNMYYLFIKAEGNANITVRFYSDSSGGVSSSPEDTITFPLSNMREDSEGYRYASLLSSNASNSASVFIETETELELDEIFFLSEVYADQDVNDRNTSFKSLKNFRNHLRCGDFGNSGYVRTPDTLYGNIEDSIKKRHREIRQMTIAEGSGDISIDICTRTNKYEVLEENTSKITLTAINEGSSFTYKEKKKDEEGNDVIGDEYSLLAIPDILKDDLGLMISTANTAVEESEDEADPLNNVFIPSMISQVAEYSTKTALADIHIEDKWSGSQFFWTYCFPQPGHSRATDGYYSANINSTMDANHIEIQWWKSSKIDIYKLLPKCDVQPNEYRQLNEGEYITFFWREGEDEDAPYHYKKYSGVAEAQISDTNQAPIIQPNFLLEASEAGGKVLVDPTKLGAEGTIDDSSDFYSKVYQMYGANDLSGTKELKIVSMKQIDSAAATSSNPFKEVLSKYFFVTNTIRETEAGPREYVMNMKKYSQNGTTNSYRYSMGPDEIFIVVDPTGTAYTVYGSGTLIGIDIPASMEDGNIYKKTVEYVSAADISEKGLSVLASKAIEVPDYEVMFCREQQLYNIVGGDTLYIQNYPTASEFKTTLILDNGTIEELDHPVFVSFGDTWVKGYSVGYKSSSSNTVTYLPSFEVAKDSYWIARACLNINSSYNEPQLLTPVSVDNASQQFIVAGGNVYPKPNPPASDDGEEKPTYIGKDSYEGVAPVYFETDIQLNKVGGENIEVSYTKLDGEKENSNLYLYNSSDNCAAWKAYMEPGLNGTSNLRLDRLYQNIIEGDTSENSSMIVTGREEPGQVTVTYNITLDTESSYLISCRNESENVSMTGDIQVGENGTIECLNPEVSGNNTKHYSVMSEGSGQGSVDTVTVTLSFTFELNQDIDASDLTASDIFTIYPYCKYHKREDLENGELTNFFKTYGITTKTILDRIQELDYKGKFNYRYLVEPSISIDDPITGKAFLDPEHIYNHATMPKALCSLNEYIGSSIQFISNR